MQQITLKHRFCYWFDNTMAKGTPALVAWLAFFSAVIILLVAVVILATGIAPASPDQAQPGLGSLLWSTLNHTLDAGTVAGDDGDWPFLLTMFVVTVFGIFVVSSLISVLSAGLDAKMDQLRKGRSFVVEKNHTLILGWSDQVFTIIRELTIANANLKYSAVVILADKDKVEMEDEIRVKVGSTGRTRVICRTGAPIDLDDLTMVNPHDARSIIILAPEDEDADSQVIKAILAITNNPDRRPEPYHIVAVIHDPRNLAAARVVGKDEVQLVEAGDLISRLIAQTCRQSGLSVVYTELLDFGGDEIYFHDESSLVGSTYGEALLTYEEASVIGLQRKDGTVQINPSMDTLFEVGDKVIVVAEDNDKIKRFESGSEFVRKEVIKTAPLQPSPPEKTLILGWNRSTPVIIKELDNYVAPGSTVKVVADEPTVQESIARRCGQLKNLTVSFEEGDTSDRQLLDSLTVETYQHIIVLSYSDILDAQRADARTLVTLLHLRDIESKLGERFSVVSEMQDDKNRLLAEVTKADDFIVSDKLISLMLAQISENKHLGAVFTDFFDSDGSEIYLRPIGEYIELGTSVNFATVIEAARSRGHTAFGYTLISQATDASKAYGVKVNPRKDESIVFTKGDRVVVLADQ